MALLDKINEMPAKQRLMILGLILALVVVGFYYGVWQSQEQGHREPREPAGREEVEPEPVAGGGQGDRALQAGDQGPGDQAGRAEDQAPPEQGDPDPAPGHHPGGDRQRAAVRAVPARGETKKEFYAEVPVDISLRGPYHNIGMFLDKVAHLPRIVSVTRTWSHQPKEEGQYIFVSGTGKIVTYRYIERGGSEEMSRRAMTVKLSASLIAGGLLLVSQAALGAAAKSTAQCPRPPRRRRPRPLCAERRPPRTASGGPAAVPAPSIYEDTHYTGSLRQGSIQVAADPAADERDVSKLPPIQQMELAVIQGGRHHHGRQEREPGDGPGPGRQVVRHQSKGDIIGKNEGEVVSIDAPESPCRRSSSTS